MRDLQFWSIARVASLFLLLSAAVNLNEVLMFTFFRASIGRTANY